MAKTTTRFPGHFVFAASMLTIPLLMGAATKEVTVVQAGAGSYLLARPQPCKVLPDVVHKTENFQQPVITGQWWSSLLWQRDKKFSQPLFAHPLAANCTERGLAVSYPDSNIHGNVHGIFGVGAGKDGDLQLGHSKVTSFQQVNCDGYSDVRDVASSDRDDPLFAYLRCFDKYAGHSGASGDANFADGNNQESSSESINGWYGMILWGEATGNTRIRDTGLCLFNTERTAVEEYWFDVAGENYPADYPNVALGMIWGGKGAFGTWFSGDIDCIHGINWLPFTPASIYMGRWPEYVKKNHDRIVEKRAGGRDYNNGWGDLVIMFYALFDPDAAADYIDTNPTCKVEGGNSHAFMYHWIHTLRNLGINDTNVTADYPIHNVFHKNGITTYAVYNYRTAPLTVNFSDGVKVVARPKALTLQRGH